MILGRRHRRPTADEPAGRSQACESSRSRACFSSRAIPCAQASIAGQSRKSPAGSASRTAGSSRVRRSRTPPGVRSGLPGSVEDTLIAGRQVPLELRELLRFRLLDGILPARGRAPDGTAAEEPDRTTGQCLVLAPHESRRLLQPATVVSGAADHEGVVAVDRAGLAHGPKRDVEALLLQSVGDPLSDALGSPVSTRIGDKDLHGRLLPWPALGRYAAMLAPRAPAAVGPRVPNVTGPVHQLTVHLPPST